MATFQEKSVLIVGAGLAGALLACYLSDRGWRVTVAERRADPRRAGYSGGRSINLALSARGIAGLRGAGLAERVLADAIPMPGRMLHPRTARGPDDLLFQPYSADPKDAINSVSRGGLNRTLLDAAEERPNVTIRFGMRCLDVHLDDAAADFYDESTGRTERLGAALLVGADGAYSAVRAAMQKSGRFNMAQEYLPHGYKELHIPPAAEIPGCDARRFDGFAMEPRALHIWPRGGSMMIALPNPDRSFTCTLFWPFEGAHSFAQLRDPGRIAPFFREEYPDAVPLMPTLEHDFVTNPTSTLVTIRCWPWRHGGRVVLLGDASHAIVPFFGQGMNAAFEDVASLAAHLERGHPAADDALAAFEAERKPNAEAIADMALTNFVEMRDRVKSRWFLLGKRLEKVLHRAMPGRFTPLYNLVSFSTVPYADALRRSRRQWGWLWAAGLTLAALLACGLAMVTTRGAVQATALTLIVCAWAGAVIFKGPWAPVVLRRDPGHPSPARGPNAG